MRVFVAGSTGVLGRSLVPQLVTAGHDVIALVRNEAKGDQVREWGAKPAVSDALDGAALTDAIQKAKPEVIIHELTAIRGVGNLKRFDEDFARTNKLRTEVLDTLIAAGRGVGARRFIAQSFCGWPFAREGGPVKTEEAPLDPDPPSSFSQTLAAIRHLESAVKAATDLNAVALRYGFFYGPGTAIGEHGSIVEMVRKHRMPVVGDGAGVWSFIHVDDAARATVQAVTEGEPGIYNVVDDEPAPVSTWLPVLADAVGARPPGHVPAWIGKLMIGDAGVSMMTRIRGGSNAKAKRELNWKPAYSSWREGFAAGLN